MNQLKADNKAVEELAKRIDKGLKASKLDDQVEALLDDANYTRKVLKAKGCYTASFVAKELGMRSAKALNKELKTVGIICKEKDDSWYLQAKYINYGLEKTETKTFHGITRRSLLWTEKGRRWLHALADRGLIQTAPKPTKKEKKSVVMPDVFIEDMKELIERTQDKFSYLVCLSKACFEGKRKKSLIREIRDVNDTTAMLMRQLENKCYEALAG